MFTGIIEEIGTVRRIERGARGARLTIGAKPCSRAQKPATALLQTACA